MNQLLRKNKAKMSKKPKKMKETVQKLIKASHPKEPDKLR